jgi:hypothetical protein
VAATEAWWEDPAESGPLLLVEYAQRDGLNLMVSGLLPGWGRMLEPPQPARPEAWSWAVTAPSGRLLASGEGLRSRAAARAAALGAAVAIGARGAGGAPA